MEKFDFSYKEYHRFIERCPFTDEELMILDMRRKNKSIVEISFQMHLPERTIARRIKSIAKKIRKEL